MGHQSLSKEQIADYYLVTPEESFRGARWQDERWANAPELEWCNQTLNAHVSKIRPGELCGIVAYSGDAKTAMALAQSYYTAKQLIRTQRHISHRVIFYTWDQTTELLELKLEKMIRYDRAKRKNVDVSQIPPITIAERIALPLWFAGKSAKKNFDRDFTVPELTIERMGDVLDLVVRKVNKEDKEVALLIGDYAQRIKSVDASKSRYENVTTVAEKFGDFVTIRNVPAILSVQASIEVKKRKNKTPRIEDAQGTTELGKVFDVGWGQWIPANSEKLGSVIRVGNEDKPVIVERGLMVVNKFKDRNGEANDEFIFPFDLKTMQIGDYPDESNA